MKIKNAIKILIGIFVLSFLSFGFKSNNDPISVISENHSKSEWRNFSSQKIIKDRQVEGEFKASANNLGIVGVRFNTFNKSIKDEVVFRIKEKTSKSWFYENTYQANQFQNDEIFPFGFPALIDSSGKSYIFQIISKKGAQDEAVSLSNKDPTFVTKYNYSLHYLFSNAHEIPLFIFLKMKSLLLSFDLKGQLFSSLILTVIILGIMNSKLNKWVEKRAKYIPHFIAIYSVVVALVLVGINLYSKLGLIDDHWVLYFLGPDLRVKLTEIPRLILSTEVGQFGHYERFRPTYYTLQVIETFLWGNNPFLWYLARLMMFAAVIGIMWRLMIPYVGIIVGFIFTLFALTYPFWSDIWTRLGPGEIYAALGSALYLLGFASLARKFRRNKTGIITLFIGFLLAVGSKENFLILLVPTIYLLVKNRKTLLKEKLNTILLVLSLLFGGLVATAIILATRESGHDVYLQQINTTSRLGLMGAAVKDFVSRFKVVFGAVPLVLVSAYVAIQKRKNIKKQFLPLVLSYLGLVALLLLLYASQYVFYGGAYPTSIRYDFPGLLVEPILLLATIYFPFKILQLFSKKVSVSHFYIATAVILFFLTWTRGFQTLQSKSEINYKATNEFNRHFTKIIGDLQEKPKLPVVFESYSLWDYEPVYSLQRYFRAYNIKNPMYLRIHGYSEKTSPGQLEKQLSKELVDSSRGIKNNFHFNNLEQLKSDECLSVVFFAKNKKNGLCKFVDQL